MTHRTLCLVALGSALIPAGAMAQTAPATPGAPETPRARTTVVNTTPAKVTVAFRGAEAKPYISVQATNSDLRSTLQDIASKANVRVVIAPSASGAITGNVADQEPGAAIAAVAKLANLGVKTVIVPEATVNAISPDAAGRYAETLTSLPAGAIVTDAATGKSLTVSATAPAPAAGQAVVYYVQGRMSPDQERMARNRPAGGPGGPGGPGANPNQPSQANQDFVTKTAQSLQGMSLQQRMDTMRALQRQVFESMTPEERDQMRQQFGGRGGRGFGGFGNRGPGGPGGPGGRGGQNQ